MRLIITGAGGFLGHHLIENALKENLKVIALSSRPDRLKEHFYQEVGLSIFEKNAISYGEISFRHGDILVNCAYPRTNDNKSIADGLLYIRDLFINAESFGLESIINISSQSVYDENRDYAAKESDLLNLSSIYAVGKYSTELMAGMLNKKIHVTNIRLGSLIGPNFNDRVINKMVLFAINNGYIEYFKNKKEYSYLDVEDAARGLLRVVETEPCEWKKIYNLGSDLHYTLEEIAYCIGDVLSELNIRVDLRPLVSQGEGRLMVDSTLIKEVIGNYQLLSLKESIKKIVFFELNRQKR